MTFTAKLRFAHRNGPLCSEEEALFENNIKYLERKREDAQKSFNERKGQLLRSQKMITHLKSKISSLENNIWDQKINVEDTRRALERFRMPGRKVSQQMKPQTKPVANLMSDSSANKVITNDDRVTKTMSLEISTLEEHIRKLQDRRSEFEIQSQTWIQEQNLAAEEITKAEAILGQISSEIQYLKSRLKGLKSPIWRVPRELWINIFQFRLDVDLSEYEYDACLAHQMPFTGFLEAAAAVCQLWRDTILRTSSLNILYIYPSKFVPINVQERLLNCIRDNRGPFKCMSNLSWEIPPSWNEDTIEYISSETNEGYSFSIPQNTYLRSNEIQFPGLYEVHLVVQDDASFFSNNIFNLPLRATKSLRLCIQSRSSYRRINEILLLFPAVNRLYLKGSEEGPLHLRNLASICPSLRTLTFINMAPNGSLVTLLNKNLVELRIYHDRTGEVYRLSRLSRLSRVSSPIRLPMLEILGITYPSTHFLEKLELPKLKTIRIKGPPVPSAHPVYGPAAVAIFQRVSKIYFLPFSAAPVSTMDVNANHTEVVCDAATAFVKLAGLLHRVQSISFLSTEIESARLIKFLENRLQKHTGDLPFLKRITISGCQGITRADCEELQTLVSQVIVHV
ncbi:hypothetical protein CPB86DRAFT_833289 [Serendipita vermifera]|nr:hypothetical protein CPB86DRAFT_833289 [Serendipita vermifera]